MITFYEGLPRAGKSYSCVRDEIIPALVARRPVVAYVEGLNFEKIADVVGFTVEECHALLTSLDREQVKETIATGGTPKDALIVIDEVQNFWPGGRGSKVDEATTKFVAEHGHDGHDIILMGQAFNDVHPIWRNRVERKIFFLKKTAFGKPNSYTATFYDKKGQSDKGPIFEKVNTVSYEYEEKYFGTYKSHTDGTTNKETKVDQRAVIWNTPLFRKWIPIFGVIVIIAVVYLWNLMHGGLEQSINKNVPKTAAISTTTTHSPAPSAESPTVRPGFDGTMPESPPDIVQEMTSKHRIRLLGTWRLAGRSGNGVIEWRDPGGEAVQSMTFRDIEGLGYSVFANTDGSLAMLVKGNVRLVATAWPIDKREGKPSDTQQKAVSGRSDTYPGYHKQEPPPQGVDLVTGQPLQS